MLRKSSVSDLTLLRGEGLSEAQGSRDGALVELVELVVWDGALVNAAEKSDGEVRLGLHAAGRNLGA